MLTKCKSTVGNIHSGEIKRRRNDDINFYFFEMGNSVNRLDPLGLAATGPTTQPTESGGLAISGGVNLVIFAPDPNDQATEGQAQVYNDLKAYGQRNNVPIVSVTSQQQIVDAVTKAFNAKGAPINVVIYGHGNGGYGPGFGQGNSTSPIFTGWEDAYNRFESLLGGICDETKKKAANDFKTKDKTLISGIQGKINQLTIGGCSVAEGSKDQALLQIISNLLDAKIVGFTGVDAEGVDGNSLTFDPAPGAPKGDAFIYPVTPQK